MFQSTHPRGVRPHVPPLQVGSNRFQSTHPRGVRPWVRSAMSARASFNPRTHEGCDAGGGGGIPGDGVSIHAPTRGATSVWLSLHHFLCVSIHAPTRGATRYGELSFQSNLFQSTHPRGVRRGRRFYRLLQKWFQSTHPRGVRLTDSMSSSIIEEVSIHAPTRGATYDSYLGACTDRYRFNPRTHEGCDR